MKVNIYKNKKKIGWLEIGDKKQLFNFLKDNCGQDYEYFLENESSPIEI